MQKTPKFDEKIKRILDSLKPGDERVCPLSGKTWRLDEKEIEICKKFNVPPSSVEPTVRMRYLNGFNTGLSIWWNKHAKTGETILSAFHPDSPFKVLPDKEWMMSDFRGDREVDFDQSVLDQLWELEKETPSDSLRNADADENSVAVAAVKVQDCYMGCGSIAKRCFYTYAVVGAEDSVDIAGGENVARSFTCGGSHNIADSAYIFQSRDCMNCSFLFDCRNCEYCFGATNKRNKRYLWFNEQLTKDEWEKRYKEVDLSCTSSANEHRRRFHELIKKEGVWPENFNVGNTDSSGELIENCTRCTDCYFQIRSIDAYRCRFGIENENCAYCSGVGWASDYYMTTGGFYGAHCRFNMASARTSLSEYCINCIDCEYCFGCVALIRQKFCIFNKQYTEEEYWPLVDKIKCKMLDDGESGEFFPAKYCLIGIQNSIGALYLNYSEEELERWRVTLLDPNRGLVLAPKKIDVDPIDVTEIPDCINEIDPEKHVGVPIHDPEANRDFSVISSEFDIYKDKRWPFPRKHFTSRLKEIIHHINSPNKVETVCDSCGASITTYQNFIFPERTIYCKQCYFKYLEETT